MEKIPTSYVQMQTNAFSHDPKDTLISQSVGGKCLMISIRDQPKQNSEQLHQMLSLSGLTQKFQNKQHTTKKINWNVDAIIPINQWRYLKCL